MRIISGKARGTKLFTLKGLQTRPTLDRVKESLFNIIQSNINNCCFLDLFSGSGAIGLEAASRGARKVIFCDSSKEAINIIKKNIDKTHLENEIELYHMNYEILLDKKISKKLDIIYIDPPYNTNFAFLAVKKIIDNDLVNKDSIIIIETDDEKKFLKQISELEIQVIDNRKYGRAYLIFVKKI